MEEIRDKGNKLDNILQLSHHVQNLKDIESNNAGVKVRDKLKVARDEYLLITWTAQGSKLPTSLHTRGFISHC